MLLNKLIGSKIQLKWVQEVWVCPVSRYSPRKYTEIERVQHKDFRDGRVEKPSIFRYGQPKSKILRSKGSSAYTMPEKSNILQSEPQRGDLNVHANLSTIRHAQCTFTTWARSASISRQSALIAWHNAFNVMLS